MGARALSPSAPSPVPKHGRTSAQCCITAAAERPVEAAGQRDNAAPSSQRGGSKPYSKWDLEKHLAEPEHSRRVFWVEAPAEKKLEIARALTERFRERDEEFQEARECGAGDWGLGEAL